MHTLSTWVKALVMVAVSAGVLWACGQSEPQIVQCVPRLVSIDTISAGLRDLEPDEFFERSYEQLLLRSPETVTAYGLAAMLSMPEDQLDDISDAYQNQTFDLQADILTLLESYDRNSLTQQQQRSYDVFHWMLEDALAGREFRRHRFAVSHWMSSPQNDLFLFFKDIHPLKTERDATNYISRLSQIENKLACLRENITLGRQTGVLPLRFMLEIAADQIRAIEPGAARSLAFYTELEIKLESIKELDASRRQYFLNKALAILEQSVIPAYQRLYETLQDLIPQAPLDGGCSRLPDGLNYYAYLLNHHTTTQLSSEEIHTLGLDEVERIQNQLRVLFDQLGYPQDETLPELFSRAAVDGDTIPKDQVIATYEQIIANARGKLDEAFDILPPFDVEVIEHPYGGFYLEGTLDGSRLGAFYAYAGSDLPRYDMPTLAYHETIPGHHLQISINQALNLPLFRRLGGAFTAYVEGWALYAEYLVKELGWYDTDIYADLGRLQYELYRAVRLVVDTGLHAKGWGFEQAVSYMVQNLGFSHNTAQGQVARYLVIPGQATAYKIGMLELLKLRKQAQDQLGQQFDLKEFHRVVLQSGRMPLGTLASVVSEYIQSH